MQQSNCNILLCNYHALVSDVLFFKEIHFNSIKRCTELTKVVFQQSLVDCKQVGITVGPGHNQKVGLRWQYFNYIIPVQYLDFCITTYLVLKIVVKNVLHSSSTFSTLTINICTCTYQIDVKFYRTLPITMSKKYYHPGSKLTRLKFFLLLLVPLSSTKL